MKQLIKVLAVGVVLAVCSADSRAATSGPFVTSTPVPFTLTDWSNSLLFPQFNPNLGVLTSVRLDFSSTLNTTFTVQNNASSSSSGWARTEVQVSVQDEHNNLIAPALDLFSPKFIYCLAPGEGTTSGLLTASGSGSELYTLASVLSEFTGIGTISLSGSTFTETLQANTGGNTGSEQVTDASLTGWVTYEYMVVPEPAIFSLVALGLGALTMLRRQRNIA